MPKYLYENVLPISLEKSLTTLYFAYFKSCFAVYIEDILPVPAHSLGGCSPNGKSLIIISYFVLIISLSNLSNKISFLKPYS